MRSSWLLVGEPVTKAIRRSAQAEQVPGQGLAAIKVVATYEVPLERTAGAAAVPRSSTTGIRSARQASRNRSSCRASRSSRREGRKKTPETPARAAARTCADHSAAAQSVAENGTGP